MLPSGWDSNSKTLSCTFSGETNEFEKYLLKKSEVALLLSGAFPSEENIDKAHEIAKTIEVHYDRIYAISDVAVAYTTLKTIKAFRKAYEATLSVSEQINVKVFLTQIAEMCRELNNNEAKILASEIEQFAQNYISKSPW